MTDRKDTEQYLKFKEYWENSTQKTFTISEISQALRINMQSVKNYLLKFEKSGKCRIHRNEHFYITGIEKVG